MPRIDIKPLTVNQAWQGRRFKTNAYKTYENMALLLLRPLVIPEGYLEIYLRFGQSNKLADWDNPIKPFVDILQKKYGFNDNRIKRATVDVDHVKKGEEYIYFELKQLEADNAQTNL